MTDNHVTGYQAHFVCAHLGPFDRSLLSPGNSNWTRTFHATNAIAGSKMRAQCTGNMQIGTEASGSALQKYLF